MFEELAMQTYISADADRALCRAQGGNNSQGPIYRVLVQHTASWRCPHVPLNGMLAKGLC